MRFSVWRMRWSPKAKSFNQETDRFEEAIVEYQQALRLRPDWGMVFNNLANTYQLMERYDKAIEAYNKALKFEPNHEQIYYNLGMAYLREGAKEKGTRALETALQINPDYTAALKALQSLKQP